MSENDSSNGNSFYFINLDTEKECWFLSFSMLMRSQLDKTLYIALLGAVSSMSKYENK